ncbi:MAG: type II toxin-antitoxin system PemK/MazF family toxin [Acidobacteriota bacterium]
MLKRFWEGILCLCFHTQDCLTDGLLCQVYYYPRKAARRIHPNESLIPSGAGGLTVDSVVLCYQIKTLDRQRLARMYGTLNDTARRDEVLKALRYQLGI